MMTTLQQDSPFDEHGRRSFLKRLALTGSAMLLTGGLPARGGAAPQARPIGLQLYTLRDRMKEDFEGTLQQVAAMGYDEVEFAGYFDHAPEQVRALLDRLGLSAPSAHVGLEQLREDLDGQIAKAKTVGHRFLTIPALREGFRGKIAPEQWAEYAAEFNEIGKALRKADLQLAYHNHHFEFVSAGSDRTGFDVLVEETDPALVSFELDLMWVLVAGRDPVRLIERYPGRFVMWHVKDLEGIAQAQADAQPGAGMKGIRPVFRRIRAVGEGDIDFARIFERAEESGLRHFFVEHDAPEDPRANVRVSYANLERLLAGQ
jgi:sugar phosphate isomerase/epimerase